MATTALPPKRRENCARCRRPPRVCYCAALPLRLLPTVHTHVLVVQHEHEKHHRTAISSVPVLTQVVENVTVVTVSDDVAAGGLGPGTQEDLDRLLYNADDDDAMTFESVLVLFPDATAKTLNDALVESIGLEASPPVVLELSTNDHASVPSSLSAKKPHKCLLVVIDGTWTEAKKIVFHNRVHLDKLAQSRRQAGRHFDFVCLDADNVPKQSLYGDLRREPMEGCLSTLEAVAAALLVLEPADSARGLHDALVSAFRVMVEIQDQFRQKGKHEKLQMYNGVSKEDAIRLRNSQKLEQNEQDEKVANMGAESNNANNEGRLTRRREYVFFATHTDFRHRKQLQQQGDSVVCTYTEARERCQALNKERKRGQRLAVLPLEHFQLHQQQAAAI
uniref:tRNA-uridine aminocarboxypropyltransferase n=1 Tax=Globisporangium ultimum (strain ATCC 200006 / CBS 805.95 / DAOM BR144) TaxID=431595 RepID=K3W5C5_GLOUD